MERLFVTWLNLFYHFILHILKRVIGIDAGGVREFIEDFSKEGIVPLSEGKDETLLHLERCLNCGNCQLYIFPLTGGGVSGWELLSSYTRSFPDFRGISAWLERFDRESLLSSLREASIVCPKGLDPILAYRLLTED